MFELQRNIGNRAVIQLLRLGQEASNGLPGTSPIVHEVLRSAGTPLDAATRGRLEPRFGYDFSRVRIHTDARAAHSAAAVGAEAYTVGRDVVFGRGAYSPGTASGQALLAHELAHVVQQDGVSEHGPLTIAPAGDRFERDADDAARERVPSRRVQRRTVHEDWWGGGASSQRTLRVRLVVVGAPDAESDSLTEFLDAAKSGLYDAAPVVGATRTTEVEVRMTFRAGFDPASVQSEAYAKALAAAGWRAPTAAPPPVLPPPAPAPTVAPVAPAVVEPPEVAPPAVAAGLDDCTPVQKTEIDSGLAIAPGLTVEAIARLKRALDGDAHELDLVRHHFKTDAPVDIRTLIDHFEQIKTVLASPYWLACGGWRCRYGERSGLDPIASPSLVGETVELCKFFWGRGARDNALTFIHEAAHRAPFKTLPMNTEAYEYDALRLPTDLAMKNAESYANYATKALDPP